MVRNVTALVNLAKTMPNLPSDHIIAMHQASVPRALSKHCINSTTSCPLQRQVLVCLDPLPADSSFPSIIGAANCVLTRVDLWVDSCFAAAYGGISLHTNRIANQDKIGLIGGAVTHVLAWDSLVQVSLPTLRSYLKIVDVPFFLPGSTDQITPDHIKATIGHSHMAASFVLANTPHVMRNSRHSDTATVWFLIIFYFYFYFLKIKNLYPGARSQSSA
jgi:hypothetical protein